MHIKILSITALINACITGSQKYFRKFFDAVQVTTEMLKC